MGETICGCCLHVKEDFGGVIHDPVPDCKFCDGTGVLKRSRLRIVLHAGCGARNTSQLHWSFKGWTEITLDLDPRCEPDYVESITDMTSIESESMDAVYCSHTIEHLPAQEVQLALKEFLRVLKPDGDLLLATPDLISACAVVVEGRGEQPLYQAPGGAVSAMDMIFGHRESIARQGDTMRHYTGFTQASLTKEITKAGFVEVRTWVDNYDLWATAQKPVIVNEVKEEKV